MLREGGAGRGDPFTNLCPAFGQMGGGQRAFLAPGFSSVALSSTRILHRSGSGVLLRGISCSPRRGTGFQSLKLQTAHKQVQRSPAIRQLTPARQGGERQAMGGWAGREACLGHHLYCHFASGHRGLPGSLLWGSACTSPLSGTPSHADPVAVQWSPGSELGALPIPGQLCG